MPDGSFSEALVEFALGGNVLAWCGDRATGGGHHADALQALDGDQLGLGFQQDVVDLPTHCLIAALGVAAAPFAALGNCVLPSFAVAGLPGDVVLVLASSSSLLSGSRVVGAVSRADGYVVLAAAVRAEHVFRAGDIQSLNWHGLWHGDLDVEAVVPALQWCSWPVVFDGHEPYGADIQKSQVLVAAQSERKAALATGEGLAIVADLEEPAIRDR